MFFTPFILTVRDYFVNPFCKFLFANRVFYDIIVLYVETKQQYPRDAYSAKCVCGMLRNRNKED